MTPLYYLHTDQLATIHAITDKDQVIVWQGEHDAFGQTYATINQLDNPLRFPGQYVDAETGLHYNWHRYYNPATRRYVSSDPIGLMGGLNTFGYAGQNSLRYVDPDGLQYGYGVLQDYQRGVANAWAEFLKLWGQLTAQVGLVVATEGVSTVVTNGLLSCRVAGTLGSNFGNLAGKLGNLTIKSPSGGRSVAQKQGREYRTDWLETNEFDPKQPKHVRGWLKNERRRLQYGNGGNSTRVPRGYVQAHGGTTPAREGYDYSNARLQNIPTAFQKSDFSFSGETLNHL